MTESVCFECGGTLEMKGGKDRVFTYRKGSDYVLPVDFQMPTCRECGEVFLNAEVEKTAKDVVRPLFLKDQEQHFQILVQSIRERHNVSLRELEKACGVTPTYLSHVLKGRKEASEVLVGLVEAFAVHPDELARRLNRKGAHDTSSVMAAVESQSGGWISEGYTQVASIQVNWAEIIMQRGAANDCEAA